MAPQNPSPHLQKVQSSNVIGKEERKRGGWGAPNNRSNSNSGPSGGKPSNAPASNKGGNSKPPNMKKGPSAPV